MSPQRRSFSLPVIAPLTHLYLGLSLAQQIAELDAPSAVGKPRNLLSIKFVFTIPMCFWPDFDPEDEQRDPPDLLGDVVDVRDHYIEVGWVYLYFGFA
jgi:hypothetical protein